MPLYRTVGDGLGEANRTQGLGDIAERERDIASARCRWSEAVDFYGRIREPYSIGLTHIRLARIAPTPAEAAAQSGDHEQPFHGIVSTHSTRS
jgi:hypothetical protein